MVQVEIGLQLLHEFLFLLVLILIVFQAVFIDNKQFFHFIQVRVGGTDLLLCVVHPEILPGTVDPEIPLLRLILRLERYELDDECQAMKVLLEIQLQSEKESE